MADADPTISFQYLIPTAEPGAPAEAYEARLDASKAGLRIVLLSNLFTDASAFLQDVGEALSRLLPKASFQLADKGQRREASVPLPADRLAPLLVSCDAVITAFGHCGSCTAGTVRDAVNIARAGIPVVGLVTEKFEHEARFVARAAGVPDVPFVFLPHPVAGREASFHRALSEAIATRVLRALTNGETSSAADFVELVPAHAEAA